ncbi:hypothetical protein AOLI_G00317630 [Acnodon oligacanthus]
MSTARTAGYFSESEERKLAMLLDSSTNNNINDVTPPACHVTRLVRLKIDQRDQKVRHDGIQSAGHRRWPAYELFPPPPPQALPAPSEHLEAFGLGVAVKRCARCQKRLRGSVRRGRPRSAQRRGAGEQRPQAPDLRAKEV